MKLEDYKNWKEVFSESEFRDLLGELFAKKNVYSKDVFLEMLSLLSEKYGYFYGTYKLTNEENNDINSILLELTDFSNLSITEDLIGILFNFRVNNYYLFLKNKNHLIKLDEVRSEVLDALKEYEECHMDNECL